MSKIIILLFFIAFTVLNCAVDKYYIRPYEDKNYLNTIRLDKSCASKITKYCNDSLNLHIKSYRVYLDSVGNKIVFLEQREKMNNDLRPDTNAFLFINDYCEVIRISKGSYGRVENK